MNKKFADIGIIGGGIIGLTIARHLLLTYPTLSVMVLEKEDSVAEHASGRNSGVLHAGFYYSPDTMKAQLTRRGNVLLHSFIEERNLPIRKTGKVVVVTKENQLDALHELARRGAANNVPLELIDESQLHKIEPYARTISKALWSPTTSVASPQGVTSEIAKAFSEAGGKLMNGIAVSKLVGSTVITNKGNFTFGHIINSAGLYADVFAKQAGVNDDLVMIPFKGLYWYAPGLKNILKSHIYPVPDIENPFLGVHFTVTVAGDVKVGPTAIPSLWREDYGGLNNVNLKEILAISSKYPRFLTSKHHNVPKLIRSELPKYNKSYLLKQAAPLAPEIPTKAFTLKGRPGVRAQLLEIKSGKLEMDFVLRSTDTSTHVLNAVSPAWTSALAVAEYVVNDMCTRKVI